MRSLLANLRYFTQRQKVTSIPFFKEFMRMNSKRKTLIINDRPTYHIQTYGCQMNINDTQIVRSVLSQKFNEVDDVEKANIVLLNTCSIREKAQEKVMLRIKQLSKNSVVGILGCMAERLKQKLFEAGVQVVCGPDAYRDLPRLLQASFHSNQLQMNIQLSEDQTYSDIMPVRRDPGSVNAYISIMRGCNNMCSFCIVPFVRGRERSRNLQTILSQIAQLQKQGVKEIIFLGQNVNSYHDTTTESGTEHKNTTGFKEMYKLRDSPGARFADLLERAASAFPNIRFRFTSPHPKDFPQQVIDIISRHNNICKYIHLPAQSGSNTVLERMRRNHTIQSYLQLVQRIKSKLPGVGISTDMICGFCGETQQQFQDTLKLMKKVKYDMAFTYAYSMRQKTHAHRNYKDDVPEEVKQRRLREMIDTFTQIQSSLYEKDVGTIQLLLLEAKSKRNAQTLSGKTDNYRNGYVQISKTPVFKDGTVVRQKEIALGDYLVVKVKNCTARALYCEPIGVVQNLNQFYQYKELFERLGQQVKQPQLSTA